MYAYYLISTIVTLLIAVLIFVYMGLRIRRWPSRLLITVFVLGFLSILLNVISVYFTNLAGLFPLGSNIKRVAFYSLITAGFVRELGKLIVIRMAAASRGNFNSPADGIVYAIMASLGFTFAALLWNIIFYQDGANELYRSILTLPANIITAIILGFFVGLGQLRNNTFIDSMTGLVAASLFHAVFEFSMIISDANLLLIIFGGSIVIVAVLINKAITLSTVR